jgi:pilus assembly protein Flp/PilA
MFDTIQAFVLDDDGATAIEYALIASIISLAVVAAIPRIAQGIEDDFQSVVDAFEAANTGT